MMQRPSSSTERSPLVQPPTYIFESSVSRSYQKRLRNFQCGICVILIALMSVVILATVSYNLIDETDFNMEPQDSVNLTMPKELSSILKQSWPLKKDAPVRPSLQMARLMKPVPEKKLAEAIAKGQEALKQRKEIESQLTPLNKDSPALRAQRASATLPGVKPLAEAAYVVEEATRVLLNGSDTSKMFNVHGIGPRTNGSYEPAYCRPPTTPCKMSKYRTFDGSCNNLNNPLLWGVSNTPFRRVLPANYSDGISAPRVATDGSMLPSARDVSITVHRPSYVHDSIFTVMLAVWGQFVDHDITATALTKGENSSALQCCDPDKLAHPECYPVGLDVEDPFYQTFNLTCMEFVRSAPAPTCHFGPREQMNQATAFIDGSTVYGFSGKKSIQLRTFSDGKLRMLNIGVYELLPISDDINDGCNTEEMNAKGKYCFESGDERANENLHLTTMHLIWARQHNRVAGELQRFNVEWTDERLFEESRRIVAAQMQHITYSEFLPAILGHDVMYALNISLEMEGYSEMYDPTVDASIANHFSAAAFRFAHTLLPGLMHYVDSNNQSVNYMHLHEMLFNPYELYMEYGSTRSMRSAMLTSVHSPDPHVTPELSEYMFARSDNVSVETGGAGAVLQASAGASAGAGARAGAGAGRLRDTLVRGPCGLDLVSLNIQRGRDHGLPAYPAWREHCGLSRPKTFEDLELIFNDLSYMRIRKIYKSVDDIDLYTGALAEDTKGRLLGPTITCLLADQFLRLKVGDRFWYETNDPLIRFTEPQLEEIRKTTLASVLCANEVHLAFAQPRVMEVPSAMNPRVACADLPQPDFAPWRDHPPPAADSTLHLD